jgi:hypothetical protein
MFPDDLEATHYWDGELQVSRPFMPHWAWSAGSEMSSGTSTSCTALVPTGRASL